jgi:hypothetical protein
LLTTYDSSPILVVGNYKPHAEPMNTDPIELRVELVRRRIKQIDVALRFPMDDTLLSKILNGRRPAPEGFHERFREVVEELSGAGVPA